MSRDSKRDPVRTTIVGGQSKVRTKASGAVPQGLETLLSRASGDQRFGKRLVADRSAAAEASGIELGPSEAALLASVTDAQLEQLISQAPPAQPRRGFIGAAAASLGALVGGVALSGCPPEDPGPVTKGIRPDVPEEPGPATKGVRPDVPPNKPDDEDEDNRINRGLRPTEPPPKTRGIQPDIPKQRGDR